MKNLIKWMLAALLALPLITSHSLAQAGWDAQTDTNGNFVWPPFLPGWQVSNYTNRYFQIWNTNTGLAVQLGADGDIYLANGGMTLSMAGGTNFQVYDANGGFGYSNGVFWINANQYYQAIVAEINTNTSGVNFTFVTNIYTAINNLSNILLGAMQSSNTLYQAAFSASNATVMAALASTNLYTSNLLAQIINTNSINLTNYALMLGLFETNYAYYLETNNGELFTNALVNASNTLSALAYQIGANATNYANSQAFYNQSTNFFGTHFRTGTFTYTANGAPGNIVGFAPSFLDANFWVTVTPAVSIGFNATNTPVMQANAFGVNEIELNAQTNTAASSVTYNWIAFHP